MRMKIVVTIVSKSDLKFVQLSIDRMLCSFKHF